MTTNYNEIFRKHILNDINLCNMEYYPYFSKCLQLDWNGNIATCTMYELDYEQRFQKASWVAHLKRYETVSVECNWARDDPLKVHVVEP